MSRILKTTIVLVLLAGLSGYALLETGLARRAFFELFAYVKGVEVLTPTVIRRPPESSPYEQWLERARDEIPMFEGLVIEDIATMKLEAWPQMGEGVTGMYLRLADYQLEDARLLEIPPGGSGASQRHLYEKGIYFVSGEGHTLLQQEGRPRQRVEWKAGDLVSIPLNVRHRHFNTGPGPARLLAVTSFPMVLNLIDDESFVLDNAYAFTGRYDGEAAYFDQDTREEGISARRNFVPDIPNTDTVPFAQRGEGNSLMSWMMAGNSMLSLHVSHMQPESYKKAHRHSSDAFILLLSGEGFSLTWPEGFFYKRERVDWQKGTLFVPPTFWYHQHFNTGPEPARYLAINTPQSVRNLGLRFEDQLETDHSEVVREWLEALRKTRERSSH